MNSRLNMRFGKRMLALVAIALVGGGELRDRRGCAEPDDAARVEQ